MGFNLDLRTESPRRLPSPSANSIGAKRFINSEFCHFSHDRLVPLMSRSRWERILLVNLLHIFLKLLGAGLGLAVGVKTPELVRDLLMVGCVQWHSWTVSSTA